MRAGLIAYGHQRKGDCGDIELLARPDDERDLGKLIGNLTPRGKSPPSAAVRKAADTLRFTEEKATVILLSDGVETCNDDPCALESGKLFAGIDLQVQAGAVTIQAKAGTMSGEISTTAAPDTRCLTVPLETM